VVAGLAQEVLRGRLSNPADLRGVPASSDCSMAWYSSD
jgi:hypothetical protein